MANVDTIPDCGTGGLWHLYADDHNNVGFCYWCGQDIADHEVP